MRIFVILGEYVLNEGRVWDYIKNIYLFFFKYIIWEEVSVFLIDIFNILNFDMVIIRFGFFFLEFVVVGFFIFIFFEFYFRFYIFIMDMYVFEYCMKSWYNLCGLIVLVV